MSSIDASIAAFEAAVTKEADKCLDDIPRFLKRVSEKAVVSLIGITPVATGHAKANWQVGLDMQPASELSTTDQTPVGISVGPTLQAAMLVLGGITLNTKVIYIVNNSDYISQIVEDGHSQQIPPGEFSAVLQVLASQL